MGVHICLRDERGTSEPEKRLAWDWGRMGGDREFSSLVDSWPHRHKRLDYEKWGDVPTDLYRPLTANSWRSEIKALMSDDGPLFERHLEIVDLLEANPDVWLYFSW